ELRARLEGDRRAAAHQRDDRPAVVLALGRPAVVAGEVLEDAKNAPLSQIRERAARGLEDPEFFHLGADAPLAPRLAGLGEGEHEVIAAADRVEGLVRRRHWRCSRFGLGPAPAFVI